MGILTVDALAATRLPLIYPSLSGIFNAQPMTVSTGLTYYIRHRYTSGNRTAEDAVEFDWSKEGF